MELAPNSRPWGECVMHVLAHVRAPGPLPASLYDPAYVAFVAQRLGPAGERALGQDVAALSLLLGTHGSLSAVQALAARYREVAEAQAEADRDFAELAGTEGLQRVEAAAELLRVSALLEAPHYARLPPAELELEALHEALRDLIAIAPRLVAARVVPMRPLGACGRLFGDEIWIGVSGGPGGTAVPELAMQAAHEASVAEVRAAADPAVDERAIEAVALVLLATRAERAGRLAEHRRWYARWSTDPRWLTAAVLAADQRQLLARCLG